MGGKFQLPGSVARHLAYWRDKPHRKTKQDILSQHETATANTQDLSSLGSTRHIFTTFLGGEWTFYSDLTGNFTLSFHFSGISL